MSDTNGAVNLEIKVQAPLRAQFDRIEVYVNARPPVIEVDPPAPYLYSATPSVHPVRGRLRPGHHGCDDGGTFDIDIENVHPVPAASARKYARRCLTV